MKAEGEKGMKDEGGRMNKSQARHSRHFDEARAFANHFPFSIHPFSFSASYPSYFILHPSSFILS
jgi:hypothetical protein